MEGWRQGRLSLEWEQTERKKKAKVCLDINRPPHRKDLWSSPTFLLSKQCLTTSTVREHLALLRLPEAHAPGPLHEIRLEFTNDFTVSN